MLLFSCADHCILRMRLFYSIFTFFLFFTIIGILSVEMDYYFIFQCGHLSGQLYKTGGDIDIVLRGSFQEWNAEFLSQISSFLIFY